MAVSYTHLIQRCNVIAGIVPRIVDQFQTRVLPFQCLELFLEVTDYHVNFCDSVFVQSIDDGINQDVYKRQARNRGIVFLGERTGGLTLLHFHL